MQKKVLLTGASGTIGTVIRKYLRDKYQFTCLDINPLNEPNFHYCNVANFDSLLPYCRDQDAIIHLALNTQVENFMSGKIAPETSVMNYNVYQAALETKVRRVVMASSVHADNFYNWKEQKLMSPNRIPVPDSPYGANKVFMETLGRYYATKGLEVVCIRFGAVNPENKPSMDNYSERQVWLSHRDCTNLIEKCIDVEKIPDNFLIVYGVSSNTSRVHDTNNPLGWVPQDNADRFK